MSTDPAHLEAIRELGLRMAESTPQTKAIGLKFIGVEDGAGILQVPYREDLVGDPETGVIASGVITTLLDHCCGLAIKTAKMDPSSTATLDLRIDYMRPAEPGEAITARAHCYKMTRQIAFVRASAYTTDPDDPVATAQGAFVLAGAPA
ncbi:MAG: PaaI family thioesterase [Caulobacteraceae bacterium]